MQMKNIRSKKKFRGTTCLNCDHPLDISDQYCPNCGQLNSTKKLSFDDFFNEFFAGIFAYDSRLRKTLVTLIFYPGKISRDYIQGKRVRYANPFKFYLSASIVFFIAWNFSNDLGDLKLKADSNSRKIEELSDQEFTQLREELNEIPAIANSNLNIDSLFNRQRNNDRTYLEKYISQEGLDSLGTFRSFTPQTQLYHQFYEQTNILHPGPALDSLHHLDTRYNQWVYKKVVDFSTVVADPKIFWDYLVGKLPFIIFFFLPVFALFIWLLYVRKKYNYMEHLIFAFHVQTTFFIIAGCDLLLSWIFKTDSLTGMMALIFLIYLYKAMRKFYNQSRFKTIVKFIILNGIFLILAVIAAMFSLVASFAIF